MCNVWLFADSVLLLSLHVGKEGVCVCLIFNNNAISNTKGKKLKRRKTFMHALLAYIHFYNFFLTDWYKSVFLIGFERALWVFWETLLPSPISRFNRCTGKWKHCYGQQLTTIYQFFLVKGVQYTNLSHFECIYHFIIVAPEPIS